MAIFIVVPKCVFSSSKEVRMCRRTRELEKMDEIVAFPSVPKTG
jgi:hypothetical protein